MNGVSGTIPLRIAVTVLAPIAVVLIAHVPLPGLRLDALARLVDFDRSTFGMFAFGLGPILTASLLVEVAALARPRWRHLRHAGPAGRARLSAWALAIGAVLSGVQAFFMYRWMVRSSATSPIFDILPTSAAGRLFVGAAPALGPLLLAGMARAIGRYGLGNGFSILIAALAIPDLTAGFGPSLRRLEESGGGALAPLALNLMVVVALISTTASRPRRGWIARPPAPALLTPASSVMPFVVATALLGLPEQIARVINRDAPLGLPSPGTLLDSAIRYPLLALVSLLLARLLNRPRRIALVWRRALHAGASPAEPDEALALAKAALRPASWRSFAFMAALAVVGALATRARLAIDAMILIVIGCVAVDLVAELRFRLVHGALAAAWPVHRLYAVGPALAALSDASIPAFPRALRHATLLSFWGPYVPVEILVPAARLDEARSLLAPMLLELGPSAGGVRP